MLPYNENLLGGASLGGNSLGEIGRAFSPIREGRDPARSFEGFISGQPHIEASSARRDASIRQACLCARIADEYRGRDIRVLDLTGVTPIFDFFVLTTATSARQARALADEVNRVLYAEGSRRISNEGSNESSWILQDFGDIVLHVFTAEARKLYDLENLWADAVAVDWQAFLDGLKSA